MVTADHMARIFGATDLIRTGDLLITSELLYQLSHSSIIAAKGI